VSVSSVLLALLAFGLPIAAHLLLLRRAASRPAKLWTDVATMALGALAFAISAGIERVLQRWSGLEKHAVEVDVLVLFYAFIVAAPLEQALKVAAVFPVMRSRHFREPLDGVMFASAAAIGFISAHNVVFLATQPPSGIAFLRAMLAVPAHIFFAIAWGYALGLDPRRRAGGRWFEGTWIAAALFNGLYDHLIFARSPAALWFAVPMLLCMGVALFFAGRALLRRGSPQTPSSGMKSRRSILPFSPVSMSTMREALLSSERPIMLRWIGLGALVTVGVITFMLVGAVALGHRFGVDFAVVDRAEGARAIALPLVILGAAALAAFPVAGFLVAKASAARNVIEPAISAAVAILGTLVLLGLAAPISVVFALAFAPIAFGLACAGAWIGMTRG
jgi:RsiW-degrading membrane proteinase PrsW (M82 family)